METADRELIYQLMTTDVRLRRLYEEHESLEDKLVRLGARTYLTPNEEIEEKVLKKRKLSGVDQMMAIVDQHRI